METHLLGLPISAGNITVNIDIKRKNTITLAAWMRARWWEGWNSWTFQLHQRGKQNSAKSASHTMSVRCLIQSQCLLLRFRLSEMTNSIQLRSDELHVYAKFKKTQQKMTTHFRWFWSYYEWSLSVKVLFCRLFLCDANSKVEDLFYFDMSLWVCNTESSLHLSLMKLSKLYRDVIFPEMLFMASIEIGFELSVTRETLSMKVFSTERVQHHLLWCFL